MKRNLYRANTSRYILILIFSMVINFSFGFSEFDKNNFEDNIPSLIKIREIKDNFSNEESNYFWSISDLCCDDENNLYVSDSKWKKIFKFDSAGKYIKSFGREGQGPGEFLGRNGLRLAFGNDRNIYVVDPSNARISIFKKDGTFIKQISIARLLYDRAIANSKGDIYLLTKDGKNAICCYDSNFKIKDCFFDVRLHFKYPFYKPKFKSPFYKPGDERKRIDEDELQKMITKEDHIVVVSDFSLTVYIFNPEHNLVNEFRIKNEIFERDFKKRLEEAVGRGGFIEPFHACLDEKENLCLVYYNSTIQSREMYRYKLDGTFLDIHRFSEKTRGKFCFDDEGNIYNVISPEKIGIYGIQNLKRR